MTQNEFYVPAYVGGAIRGISVELVNGTASDINALPRNGVYYVYQGQKFPLLVLDGITVPANSQKIVSVELHDEAIPSTDIKLMVDTAGLKGITATVSILWGV